MKATVLYLKDTGHVLAIATRVAPVEPPAPAAGEAVPPAVRALAGGALPARGFMEGGTTSFHPAGFRIPAEDLLALDTELDDAQMLSPRRYAVFDGETLEVPPPDPLAETTYLTDSGNLRLKVKLHADTTENRPVLVQVMPATGGEPLTLRGEFRPGSPTQRELEFALATPMTGANHLLVLVRGYRAGIRHIPPL